jgi:hypothetical protein
VNGHWVLGRLRRLAPRVLVLHGHRHIDWAGRSGGLRILSAPSPVMGPTDEAGGFWIQRLAPGPEGGLVLLAPRRVAVPGGSAG